MALIARNEVRLAATARAAEALGGSARCYAVDLADPAAGASVASRILDDLGPPDILINSAGAGRWLPFLDTTMDDAGAMMAVPYLAAFQLCRGLLPSMLAARRGQIAFVSSPGSYLAWPNATAYLASRHALKALAEGLRVELKGTSVSVTLAILGEVETEYWTHNPGSRERLPRMSRKLFPVLSADDAAGAIADALDRRARRVFKPALLCALPLLDLLAPKLVAKQMRRATKTQ